MKRAYRILPCYAGDVSGVCSALYELGGMVVIHDPSGCNSTYNTHDETRWFSQDSMIYLSGLSELDAILGSDKRLLEEICETAQSLQPRFVAIASSPIPYLSGQDLTAIARLVEQRTGIPSFYVPTNGLRDYNKGMEQAFLQIEHRFLAETSTRQPNSVNILGMTPLDYGQANAAQSLRMWLETHGYHVQSCWAMGSTLDELALAGEAEVNLVVSAAGLPLARALWRRYGTPYVAGIPVGDVGDNIRRALRTAVNTGMPQLPCLTRGSEEAHHAVLLAEQTVDGDPQMDKETVTLVGEPVLMGSLAAAIAEEYHVETRMICSLDVDRTLLAPQDLCVHGEEEMEQALQDCTIIVADPMYQPVCPQTATFYPLPHQAFSGRNGWRTARDLITMDLQTFLHS